MMWWHDLRAAAVLLGGLSVLTGVIYPVVITGAAQAALPFQANGSVLRAADGTALGSALIGQAFGDPRLLWGRPSATGGAGAYDGSASSGSNLGPSHPALRDSLTARVARLEAAHPDRTSDVPLDLVTASGSGLDPHISPAAAAWQVGRIAAARSVAPAVGEAAIAASTESAFVGLIGDARVNVLAVNLRLEGRLQ